MMLTKLKTFLFGKKPQPPHNTFRFVTAPPGYLINSIKMYAGDKDEEVLYCNSKDSGSSAFEIGGSIDRESIILHIECEKESKQLEISIPEDGRYEEKGYYKNG